MPPADKPGGWLDRFMKGAEKRGLRVDFIPVHWYGSDFSSAASYQLADYLQRIHDRHKKPIWLTECALIDFTGGGTPRYPSQQEQTRFIKTSTEALEVLDFVKRYAWFALSTKTSPTGLYDGTTANASGNTFRYAPFGVVQHGAGGRPRSAGGKRRWSGPGGARRRAAA